MEGNPHPAQNRIQPTETNKEITEEGNPNNRYNLDNNKRHQK